MTELTNLTVAQIRNGHRAGDFSAVEVAEAFSANVAGAKALNAFIVETPEHALSAATARRGSKKYFFDVMTVPFVFSNRVDLNRLKLTAMPCDVCLLAHIKKND